ncbi:MAG TPA: ISNCY family transposase [bacterium]|nr:ISNCY family transposase [bacterium]
MTRETITLTKQEQQRAHVLSKVQEGTLTASAAASLMSLSVRHVRRLLAEVRAQGPAALAHGNRGCVSHRRLSDAVRTQVVTLARTTYAGINDHQLTELLREREALTVSRPSVQRLLREAGIGSPRTRRPPRHRRRRERMPQAGLLIQMDGSHHPWLEDRGPRLVLLAAIDDATGELLGGIFREEEDSHGYLLLLRQLITRYGVPAAIYTDRHGIFHRDPRTPLTVAEELEGRLESTQVGRAMQELGLKWIPANSPQAKGRVERLFGTLQDRLVVELRLAGAQTGAQAQRVFNRFRRRFNARFAHAPADATPAWRPAPPDLEQVCCFKHERKVQHDNTVQLQGRWLQLRPGPNGRSYAGLRVTVRAHLNGTLAVVYRGQPLAVRTLSHAPRRATASHSATTAQPAAAAPAPRTPTVPSSTHPWRRMIQDDIYRQRLLQR